MDQLGRFGIDRDDLPSRRSGRRFPFVVIPIVVVAGLILGLFLVGWPHQVNASENCISLRGGAFDHTADKGFEWVSPAFEDLVCYTAQRLTYESVGPKPGQDLSTALAESDADYKEQAPEARSNDPQKIDYMPYRIVFEVPDKLPQLDDNGQPVLEDTDGDGKGDTPVYIREDNIRWVYENIGHSMEDVVRRVVTTHSRSVIRQNLGTFSAEYLFSKDIAAPDGPQDISLRELRPLFLSSGVVLRELLIGKPDFNDEFEKKLNDQQLAVRDTAIAKQKALTAEQEGQARVNAAKADAQVAEEAAKGTAAAQIAAAAGEATANVTRKKGEAEGIREVAQAQADQQRLLVESYGGPEYYAQVKQYEAMGHWQITTVMGGDSSVLPVLPMTPVDTVPHAEETP